MELTRCANGHFFDLSKYTSCPHCNSESGQIIKTEEVLMPEKDIKPRSLVRCSNGHFYDESRYVTCPHCENDKKSINPLDHNSEPFIFISYCHKDFEEVNKILNTMKINHFRYWYDERIKSGIEWADEIAYRIKKCEQFVCFISKSTLESENTKDEIHLAYKHRCNIIVVYLEEVNLTDGLELQLDRKQAILKYKYSNELFLKKFLESLSTKALIPYKSSVDDSIKELKKSYEFINKLTNIASLNEVYLAKNIRTNSRVIIKHGKFDKSIIGNTIKESYKKEKEILSKNISPYIPVLYDYYQDCENTYLVEEYVEGTDLSKLNISDKFKVINIVIRVAKILDSLHKKGYVHCDVNPKNIICSNTVCFLIDYGSAKTINSLDREQICMGTPGYAAPEQYGSYNGKYDIYGRNAFENQNSDVIIDARTDIYGLGKTLISLLSENLKDDDGQATSIPLIDRDYKSDNEEYGLANSVFTDPLLNAIIDKMTRDHKDERFNSMSEIIEVLNEYLKAKL